MNLNGKNKIIQKDKFSIIKFLANIPLFVQFYILITIFIFILNLFIKDISNILSNIPSKTILQFQFWRLITSVFMTTNQYKIILGIISWIKFASSIEKTIGTIKYMFIFIINSIIIQLIYCLFIFFSSLFNKNNANKLILNTKINVESGNNNYIENNGMWSIIICELVLLCLNNPQSKIKILFFPFTIKAKYYPLLFYLLLSLFDSFKIDLQIISGIFYGIIYFYFLKNIIKISDSFAYNIEDNYCFKLAKIKNFKKCKRNNRNNIIISNNQGSYSPVQITTSSSFNNLNNNNNYNV